MNLDAFWAKVSPEPNTGCWLWAACTDKGGYGHLGRRKGDGSHLAHRQAYEFFVGRVPAGLELDHTCRNVACVNPKHLEPVTHLENVRRGTAGAWMSRRTHCKNGHQFTPENTTMYTSGGHTWRHCKACGYARDAKRRGHA